MSELEHLENKILLCKECPQGEYEFGWGTPGKIMFIGQCPALASKGRRGTSDFDKYLFELIYPLTDKDFYFTNLIKVPMRNMNDVSLRTLVHCGEHLLEEIIIVKPEKIIALGSWSRSFCEANNINHYSLPHPGYIFFRGITEDEWKKQLKGILNI